ncbi:MAG: ferritin-like domain-containing protein [Bdellovibrionota bacterium]
MAQEQSWKHPEFPPYHLMNPAHLEKAQNEYRRLENLYHKTQSQAWDGKELLAQLVEKHGGIKLPEEKKKAIAEIFSIILWGELAAWQVSAALAEKIPDVEARMAATGQTFDEARHFYTMRDYLITLGVPTPRINWYSKLALDYLINTDNLVYKLVGMQLLVENIAVHLFKNVAGTDVEPVLSELMPYFERDEARHVGLGVMYLPELLKGLSAWDQVKLAAVQGYIYALVVLGGWSLLPEFQTLGINVNQWLRRMGHDQADLTFKMGRYKNRKGVLVMPKWVHKIDRLMIDFFVPENLEGANPFVRWFNTGLARMTSRVGRILDRVTA